jgi:hypothetical protein
MNLFAQHLPVVCSHAPRSCWYLCQKDPIQSVLPYFYLFSLVLTSFSWLTTWAMPQPFFCFSYFSDRVLNFLPGPASDQDPPLLHSQVAYVITSPRKDWRFASQETETMKHSMSLVGKASTKDGREGRGWNENRS